MTINIFATGLFSFVLTVILVLRGSVLAEKLGLMDVPGGRKVHKNPTPLMGGLAIMLIIAPSMVLYTLIFPYYFQSAILVIATVGVLIAVLALVDDRHHIPPIIRLIISALIFSVAMLWVPGLQIGTISWGGGTDYISFGRFTILLTALSLIALVNAINMADGKNGLVTGLCFGFSLILLIGARANLAPVIAILVGATFALFIFNLKGRMFLGDGGSYGLAALIGLFAIYVYQRSDVLISADQVGLMFMIPVADMGRLMVNRISSGRSPFEADRNHLHHLLQVKVGWSKGLLIYWMLVFLPLIVSILWPSITWIVIGVAFLAYISVLSFSAKNGFFSRNEKG